MKLVVGIPGNEIGKEDGEECRWCGEGYGDGEHIVLQCEKMWPERGQKWCMWEDLDNKRCIVLVEARSSSTGSRIRSGMEKLSRGGGRGGFEFQRYTVSFLFCMASLH